MDRNLELYPWYQALRNGVFWLPVFFLYFLSVVSLEEALLLESIYYLAVVTLEDLQITNHCAIARLPV